MGGFVVASPVPGGNPQLDFDGVSKKLTIPEGTSVLEAAEMVRTLVQTRCSVTLNKVRRHFICSTIWVADELGVQRGIFEGNRFSVEGVPLGIRRHVV